MMMSGASMSGASRLARDITISVLVPLLALSTGLQAQTHIVSPADLTRAVVSASTARQHHLDTVNGFLSSTQMEKVLTTAGVNTGQLKTVVSALDDQELAKLAARSEKVQADFAAGRLSDRDLLLLLLGFAALILIIVAVR